MTPTVGLALIARDEAKSLPALLKSIEGAFDQIVLVDTGSKDETIHVFTAWAREQTGVTYRVDRIAWVGDFAAARAHADSLLTTDWNAWADCDDVLVGAEHLRTLAQRAPENLVGYIAVYDYAMDSFGNVVCVLKRERLVRAGHGEWIGRVHEAQILHGGATAELDPDEVRWVHRKAHTAKPSSPRNLRILRAWAKDEPRNPRVLAYLGTEEAGQGRPEKAIRFFRKYLALKTGWDEERAQVHRKLSACLYACGKPAEAQHVALEALKVRPDWPDTYLSLAEACYGLGEHAKAVEWAREVLRRGQPESLLILCPLDYCFQPRHIMAAALGALGQTEDALRIGEEALAIVPNHGDLGRAVAGWRATVKRESTAATFAACAELLVSHDEQLKALTLLEQCVPYYAADHPRVVQLRSMVRERLLWLRSPETYAVHYDLGGSKPEDFIGDDRVMEVAGSLPRAHFLAGELADHINAREDAAA